jgi:aspartyl-tRNA(Asn)/glutamyl-tRNA(Gln) amidotransferase subunit C
MSLSDDQVRRIARLARIEVSADESGAVIDRLNRVLALVGQIQGVDTAGVAPMAHPLDAEQRLRPDEVTEPDRREAHQAVAPAVQDGLYLVPKVIE